MATTDDEAILHRLEHGHLYEFSEVGHGDLPPVAAGVYTVWQQQELLYVGMAGRSLTSDTITESREISRKNVGLRSRLRSHASGRRSGDQFCVYVCDRLVLPTLSRDEIAAVAAGTLSLDKLTREYVLGKLAFRFAETPDGAIARRIEADIRRGNLAAGRPTLNPLRA
jgi:hypothetical protein